MTAKTKARDKPIRVAVAGLGRAGWDIHVAGLRADRRYVITAVFDPDSDRRRQAEVELGCCAFKDYAAMLKETDADLVVVASPSRMHPAQAIAAMKAGKHVSVEKPIAPSLAEADRMIRTAKGKGVKLFIHHNYRFNRSFTFMRKVMKEQKIGRVFHIGFCHHNYSRRNDWQCLAKYSGGLLNNHGTHMFDQALTLAGGPVADIFCDMKHISDAGNVEDHVKMLVRTNNGITIEVDLSTAAATTRHAPEWTLLGTRGAVTISGGEAQMKYYPAGSLKPLRVKSRPMADGRRYWSDTDIPWKEKTMKAIGPAVGTFYDAVHATLRKRKKFPIDPDQVRELIRVIAECRKMNPAFPGK